MADVFWTEFENIALATVAVPDTNDGGGSVQVAKDAKASGSVTASGSNQQSSAFNAATNFVRIATKTEVFLQFGSDPDASSGTQIALLANTTEYFGVEPGQKLSVVTTS